MEYTITLTDTPDDAMQQAIVTPLVQYNDSKAGPSDYRPLAVIIRNTTTSGVMGGMWGHTGYGWLFTQLLVVPDGLRGRGLGTEVMQVAEREAILRGCHSAWLDTHEFQAKAFYSRLGDIAFGELPNYPIGFSRIFMQKSLSAVGRDVQHPQGTAR